ncbi:MAG: EAL domain-containing protein [Solirubrobacterales bacterium]
MSPRSTWRRAEAIARSTIDLARHLDLHVVAEGVETQGALDRLVDLGCDTAQGYLFSRPVPAQELTARLMEDKRAAAATARGGGPELRPVSARGRSVVARNRL